MNTKGSRLYTICLSILLAVTARASDTEIAGVFGIAPVPEGAALAVWVPLKSGESVRGVMWYNNDGGKAFPELLAAAGDPRRPEVLGQAVVVAENVQGQTLGWSEYPFTPAFASADSGLFIIFRLPEDGPFVAEGDGAGMGYQIGGGQIRSWVSTGDGEWGQLSSDYQMAVAPVVNATKSGDVITLRMEDYSDKPKGSESPPAKLVSGMRVAPNPFNPRTAIAFSLPSSSDVTLSIYDVRGREVATLVSGFLGAGDHTVDWDGTDGRGQQLASGVYFAQLRAGAIHFTGRLTLVR